MFTELVSNDMVDNDEIVLYEDESLANWSRVSGSGGLPPVRITIGADRTVVYGVTGGDPDELVFVPRAHAVRLASIWDVLRSELTWAEAHDRLTAICPIASEHVANAQAEDDIDPSEPFDPYSLPGHGDGDWPEWLSQLQLNWVPETIQNMFGEAMESITTGPALRFEVKDAEALVSAFDRAGFRCIRDDALVSSAAGY